MLHTKDLLGDKITHIEPPTVRLMRHEEPALSKLAPGYLHGALLMGSLTTR